MSIFKKIFNPSWNTVLEQIINVLFFFMGSKIKGYRTIIVNTITAILGGLAVFQTNAFFDFICNIGVGAFCGGEESVVWGVILTVISLLNIILRKVTGDNTAEFKLVDSAQAKTVNTAAIIAAIALGILIITLVV